MILAKSALWTGTVEGKNSSIPYRFTCIWSIIVKWQGVQKSSQRGYYEPRYFLLMHKSESNPHSGKMWNISRKRAAAVYSPHLNWHSTLAVVPSIFYCDTLHPRFYQIPESQSWSRLYCDSHIGVKSFMKSKLKIWYFITCTIRIVPGWWAWSQLPGPGTILMR